MGLVLLAVRFWYFLTSHFGTCGHGFAACGRRGAGEVRDLHRGELLDEYLGRSALALPDTLNEADTLGAVQLRQQADRFAMAAAYILLDLLHRVVDVHPPLFVIPTVAGGQAHSVQQQGVQQLGVCGQTSELLAGDEDAGEPVVAERLQLAAIEIVVSDLLAHNCPPCGYEKTHHPSDSVFLRRFLNLS